MSGDTLVHAVSGAAGGALAAVVTYPLITLSTREQTRTTNKDGLFKLKTLYAGLDSAIYGMTLTNFVYYYFYEGLKTCYVRDQLGAGQSMLIGSVSGAATALVTNPIWVVNTRVMVTEDSSTLSAIRDILKKDGAKAFLSGLGPSLMLVLNPVINYSVYEQLRQALLRNRNGLSSLETFLLGAFSKIVATTVTYPLITIKSRLQARSSSGDHKVGNAPNVNIIIKLFRVLKQLSLSDLYRGWSLKVTQSALQSAFLFLFKDYLYALSMLLIRAIRRARSRRVAVRV